MTSYDEMIERRNAARGQVAQLWEKISLLQKQVNLLEVKRDELEAIDIELSDSIAQTEFNTTYRRVGDLKVGDVVTLPLTCNGRVYDENAEATVVHIGKYIEAMCRNHKVYIEHGKYEDYLEPMAGTWIGKFGDYDGKDWSTLRQVRR